MKDKAWLVPVLLMIVLITNCTDKSAVYDSHSKLVKLFNSKGKYARFSNSNLIFGDTLNRSAKELLNLDVDGIVYRKSAFRYYEENDSIIYYMYGISKTERRVDELRIRSFKKDSMLHDNQIINFNKDTSLNYDYSINEDLLIIRSDRESLKTHHSFYKFENGEMINETFIPDTIFRRQDLIPDIGRTVRIINDFKNKTVSNKGKSYELLGKITNRFRDENCMSYMTIKLEENTFDGYKYFQTHQKINDESPLFGIENDSLTRGITACEKGASILYHTPELLKEKIYIEYE